jgi:hypothetical protein
MTREQIKTLMSGRKSTIVASPADKVVPKPIQAIASRPSLAPQIAQYFVPVQGPTNGRQIVYKPAVIGHAKIAFADRKYKIDSSQEYTAIAWVTDGVIPVSWEASEQLMIRITALVKSPSDGAQFSELPTTAAQQKSYSDWEKDFVEWLVNHRSINLLKSKSTGVISNASENERDFRIRMQQTYREKRDEEIEKIRRKYAARIASLQERVRRAQQAVERQREQASATKQQAAISFGASLLTSFLGRKASISRSSYAMRGLGRSMRAGGDVQRAHENAEALQGQLESLESELRREVSNAENRLDSEAFETIKISPSRSDISTRIFGLAWVPFWKESESAVVPAWK